MTDRHQSATRGEKSSPADRLESGTLSVLDLVFFVVAAAAPLTVMVGFAPLAIGFGGIGAPGGYLFAGIVLTIFAVGFTAMSRYVRNAGAFYAYIARGISKPVGVGAALLAIFSYSTIEMGLLGVFAMFASNTVANLFGLAITWEVWIFLALAIITWLAYRRVALSAKVLGVALTLEVLILLVLAIPVLIQGGAEGFVFGSFAPQNIFTGGVGAMFVLTFGAFIGFEATAIYSEEARSPQRTVPRATYIAVGFLGLFYALISWMIIIAFGAEEALSVAKESPADMFFIAMGDYVGGPFLAVLDLLIITSAFAASLAFHNATARYFYAMGRERVLPSVLGRTHPTTHSPWVGVVAQAVIAALAFAGFAIAGADPYLQLGLWASGVGILGVIILWAICALAIVGFFLRDRRETTVWQRLIAPILAFVGLATATVFIILNFDLLTGVQGAFNIFLIALLVVFFVTGVLRALRLRQRDPEAYENLTNVDVEDS